MYAMSTDATKLPEIFSGLVSVHLGGGGAVSLLWPVTNRLLPAPSLNYADHVSASTTDDGNDRAYKWSGQFFRNRNYEAPTKKKKLCESTYKKYRRYCNADTGKMNCEMICKFGCSVV